MLVILKVEVVDKTVDTCLHSMRFVENSIAYQCPLTVLNRKTWRPGSAWIEFTNQGATGRRFATQESRNVNDTFDKTPPSEESGSVPARSLSFWKRGINERMFQCPVNCCLSDNVTFVFEQRTTG